jgi:hypothetical protein
MKFSIGDTYETVGTIFSIDRLNSTFSIHATDINSSSHSNPNSIDNLFTHLSSLSLNGITGWSAASKLQLESIIGTGTSGAQGHVYPTTFITQTTGVTIGQNVPGEGGYVFHLDSAIAYVYISVDNVMNHNSVASFADSFSLDTSSGTVSDVLPIDRDLYYHFKTNVLEPRINTLNANINAYWLADSYVRNNAYYVNPVSLKVLYANKNISYPPLLYRTIPRMSEGNNFYGLYNPYFDSTESALLDSAQVTNKDIRILPVKVITPQKHAILDVGGDSINLSFNSETQNDNNYCMMGQVNLPSLFVSVTGTTAVVEEQDFTLTFPLGWSIFSLPFDISTLTKITHGSTVVNNPSLTSYTDQFGLTYNSIKVSDLLDVIEPKVTVAKDNNGKAWITEFNFDGIPLISKHDAFQIKTTEEVSVTFTAKPDFNVITTNNVATVEFGAEIKILAGWNIMRFPLNEAAGFILNFRDVVEDLIIAKDELGKPYLPEYAYSGVENFLPGKGYQVKMKDTKPVYTIKFEGSA